MIVVQVWPHRYVRGWNGQNTVKEQPQVELSTALTIAYPTDAHFAPYAVNDRTRFLATAPRLRKGSLQHLARAGLDVALMCAPLDIDAPKVVRAGGEPMVVAWYAEQVEALVNAPSAAYRYRTRGGYRLIYLLSRPLHPSEYERTHYILRTLVSESTGGAVIPDEACGDWTRCYRLPFVVRDGRRQEWPLEARPNTGLR